MFILFIVLCVYQLQLISTVEENCFNTSSTVSYRFYLNSKTPYRYLERDDFKAVHEKDCVVKKSWGLIRHGTRTPGEKIKIKIENDLQELRDKIVHNHLRRKTGKLCNVSELKVWKLHNELDGTKRLTKEGESEMQRLGERFKIRFPGISNEYSREDYKLKYTATSRTENSAKFFTLGLFGNVESSVWFPPPLHKDPILRFYKLCDNWNKNVNKNPEAFIDVKKFENSDIMNNIVDAVSKRLGFSEDELSLNDVRLMYTTCSFETAWDEKYVSPWCGLFTDYELEVLQYARDLNYYWKDGYGYNITSKMACVALNDMISHFKSDNRTKAVFYFTHSGTILKFLTHLGLYKDDQRLTYSNFHELRDRKWKTSKIDAFGSNIFFILYKCGNDKKILTLHQERPVTLPGCPLNELCSLSKILEIYKSSVHDCNFDEICTLDKSDILRRTEL